MSTKNCPAIITSSELLQTCKTLEAAIQSGDVETAKELAQLLSLHKTQVSVTLKDTAIPEGKFWLKVVFDNIDHLPIDLHVDPHFTIGNVKLMIHKKLGFRPERQHCVVKGHKCQDNETLASCGLTFDGCVVSLVVLPEVALNDAGPSLGKKQILSNADGTKRLFLDDKPTPSTSATAQICSATMPSAGTTYKPLRLGHGFDEDEFAFRRKNPQGAPATITSEAAAAASPSKPEAPQAAELTREPKAKPPLRRISEIARRNEIPAAAAAAPTGTRPVPATGNAEPTAAIEDGVVRENEIPARDNNNVDNNQEEGLWSCGACTYLNHPDLLECELCGLKRFPEVEEIPDEAQRSPEEVRLQNYDNHLLFSQNRIVTNMEAFKCDICLEDCGIGDGVVLRECLHMFCRSCLENLVQHSEDPIVTCPFNNGDYKCNSALQECEIKALVSDEVYQKHLQRSLILAESQAPNSYHCATPNCAGWCLYEDEVNMFYCATCQHWNCLTCRAIHEKMDCIQYQRKMKAKFHKDYNARMAQSSLEDLFKMGEALKCPTCGIIIMKKEGCDWIMCTMCKTEICWVTRQARWGPKGHGDNSGGCKCRVNGKLCHPTCQNCH